MLNTSTEESVSGIEENVSGSSKKYFDIDTLWLNKATPEDEIKKYNLITKIKGKYVKAFVLEDPVIPITKLHLQYLIKLGFVTYKTSNKKSVSIILRKNLEKKHIYMLRQTQYIDPKLYE